MIHKKSKCLDTQKIFKYIDQNSNRFLEEYKSFLQQPSISAQDIGIKACADLLKKMMQDVGITASIIPTRGHPIVFGTLQSKNTKAKTLLIYGHYDVQPPEPLNEWISTPFKAETRNDNIYARGATDDKQLFIHLKATEAFLQTKGDVPLNLKFLFEGEEEIGSPNLPKFVKENKELLAADAMICFDGNLHSEKQPMVMLGSKGILTVELSSKCADVDIHSSYATIVQNPAWKLIWALNSIKNIEDKILIDGWYDNVKAPTQLDITYLKKLLFEEEEVKKKWGISTFINDLTDLELVTKLLFAPTCTVVGFDSGYKGPGFKTVLPSKAFAKIDFRLVNAQKPNDCLLKLKTHLKKHGFSDIEVKVHGTLEPSKTEISAPINRAVMIALEQIWGIEPVVYPTNFASGPGYLFTKFLGLQKVKSGIGHPFSNLHAPNEFLPIDNFFKGCKASAAVIMNFSQI